MYWDSDTRRRKQGSEKSLFYLSIAVVLILASYGLLIGVAKVAVADDSLKTALNKIKRGIDRYGLEHGGFYPKTVDEVVRLGYIEELPENPYTGRPVDIITRDRQPQPGSVLYIPKGQEYDWTDFQDWDAASPAFTIEYDGYWLFIFGSTKSDLSIPRDAPKDVRWNRVAYYHRK